MKVYLGPYSHWFQPYTWAKRLVFWAHERKKDDENKKLDMYERSIDFTKKWFGWLRPIEDWIDARTERKVRVRVDAYDVWSADHSLALIILPVLQLLRQKKHGAPHVDDADVPEELRSTSAPALSKKQAQMGSIDDNHFKRWEWVSDEMVWAFEQVVDEDADSQFHYDLDPAKPRNAADISFEEGMRRGGFDQDGYLTWQNRKTRGLTLFGKYYEALWD